MPARHHILIILAFWLAMTGWLVYRDLWPRFGPGDPPPFTIDLADEANPKMVPWVILKTGPRGRYQDQGYCHTLVFHREADHTFVIRGMFKLWSGDRGAPYPDYVFETQYTVTPTGEVREVQVEGSLTLLGVKFDGTFQGQVQKQEMIQQLKITGPGGFRWEPALPPVPVSGPGTVMSFHQPINRMPTIRPGQHWQVPLENTLAKALKAAVAQWTGFKLPDIGPRILNAQVLPEVQVLPDLDTESPTLPRKGGGVRCYVVEYTGENAFARTWVRQSDGLVLRQEARFDDQTWILDRDRD